MDGTIVFIFLLDHLPESILNKTLEPIDVTHTEYSGLNQCDYHITDPLLQIISRELEVLMIPKWLVNKKHNSSKQVNLDKTYARKINKIVDSSAELDRKAENKLLKIEHALHEINHLDKHETESFTNYEDGIPIKAPLMAAIFESLSNVTAQTCGGTVVAPQWVLTAASCVNLLSNLNTVSAPPTEKSVYTIIINATDPLIDGSAHNVTEILVHPNDNTSDAITRRIGRNPVLALMKIEPAVTVDEAPVLVSREDSSQHVRVYGWTMNKVSSDVITRRIGRNPVLALMKIEPAVTVDEAPVLVSRKDSSQHVRVYGWTMNKVSSDVITRRIGGNPVLALMKIEPAVVVDETPVLVSRKDSSQHVRVYGWTMNKTIPDNDVMYPTSFEALILSPQDCSVHYNISKDTSEICLATTDEYEDIISQLSWGGPVVSQRGGIVGVSRGDSHAPLAAWPLVAHIDWIHGIAIH